MGIQNQFLTIYRTYYITTLYGIKIRHFASFKTQLIFSCRVFKIEITTIQTTCSSTFLYCIFQTFTELSILPRMISFFFF